jgi:putative phosphoribosyl transferase
MHSIDTEVTIPVDGFQLHGDLIVPEKAKAIIIFSHGSGSSRFSPRNTFVAFSLNKKGFATLLIDLLTPNEELIYENRFNIPLLTERLIKVTEYIQHFEETKHLCIGYFGASTGAASAIKAAANLNGLVHAIVSRGGRPDLAEHALSQVSCPTLLLVGSMDDPVIMINEYAYKHLCGIRKLIILDGATHLFHEKGKLEEVAKLSYKWFDKYL